MTSLTQQQLTSARGLIFCQGRLLERQLYRYVFEEGERQACLKALLAYQNPDGGFGNGLEPDLLCPGSSAIGAETALFILDLLDYQEPQIILPLLDWLAANQDETGGMRHPPQGFEQYPHQPWWEGDDAERVLVLATQLKDWQDAKPFFFAKARQFYDQTPAPEEPSFYSYPQFAYLTRYQQSDADSASFRNLLAKLLAVLADNAEHFPLFSRYWYYAQDYVEPNVLDQAAAAVTAAFLPEGGIPNPYPDLPWWQPIFTLDSLILLKKSGYL
ncbi:hypothetical protein XM38_027880 [Halomicronema hongdechloris C2206]|uniref:Prenyltransferase n=1 Tax=Halomicronema hongdechloris C2206 TaxID=1641165 RepID=A0A1Z3HNE5_9CYAN|nr:hypothetical protein [Halomicronema hongdechloris]ASC71834.1 hypothetical protein XM38_027880 [Halomicronema hongdechloris C2206]